MLKKLLVALGLCLAMTTAAFAQTPPTPGNLSIKGGESAPISVTTSSASVALPASTNPFSAVVFFNDGASEAFVALGNGSATAVVNVNAVPPGCYIALFAGTNNFAAAITASGTTTIRVTQWTGAPPIGACAGGSSSNPSTVTISQGGYPATVTPGGALTTVSPTPATSAYPNSILAVTGTAVQLTSNALVNGIICQVVAPSGNKLVVGNAGVTNVVTPGGATGIPLSNGQSWAWSTGNSANLYINGTAGDGIVCSGN